MVDLARQAFDTNNFDLAADIYERTIRETGPKSDLFLGLADSLARGGQFSKAFIAYTNAYRYGKVSHERLKHLVTGLILTVKQDQGGQQSKKSHMFTCGICRSLLDDPVTIPCGHSFCRKCLQKDTKAAKTCDICGTVHFRLKIKHIKSNVILGNLIGKWFPSECEANRLKREGNKCVERGDFLKASEAYSKAINIAPNDHILLSNRCHVFISMERFSEALKDATDVVRLRPDWAKGYFRKGSALFGLGNYEDAVVAFLQCLSLDAKVVSAKDYLSKSLDRILSALPPDDPKFISIQQQRNPCLFHQLIQKNFNRSLLLPDISGTLSNLTLIMQDTVDVANSFDLEPNPRVLNVHYSPSNDQESSSEATQISDISQMQKWRSYSLPDCSLVDHEELERTTIPRSYSPRTVSSRKRMRNGGSAQAPISPTQTTPEKNAKFPDQPFSLDVRPDAVSVLPSTPNGEKSQPADFMQISPQLLSTQDVECGLCYRLFYEPVTTPCGHTFCRQCLDRSLDHTVSCPLCKSNIAEHLAERRQAVTESIKTILEVHFKEEFLERCKIHDEEMIELTRMGSDQQSEIPIFICTQTFPSMPCPLHIFEPRYRLMVRQCMESGTRQFGMSLPASENDEDFADYGVMLEIRDVQYFPDGRSVLDTVGGRRFKVLSRGCRDGYNTAKVEFIKDMHISDEERPAINQMKEEVHRKVKGWISSLPLMSQMKINCHFGDMPNLDMDMVPLTDSGPCWAWWCLAVLPLDPKIKSTIMALSSLQERLKALNKVMERIERTKSN